ncbi:glycoprotease [Campylobacterota bacterium]|nr:glycoprotease [Campylobacterota bacterium]
MSRWKKPLRENVSLLIIAAAKPMIAAIYGESGSLIKAIESEKQLSEALCEIVEPIDREYAIVRVLYANGPGSFMGLKLSYIFLRAFSIARDIEFLAAESFAFSGDRAILAHKNRWFVKKPNGEIVIENRENAQENSENGRNIEHKISAPSKLDLSIFCGDTAPQYILNAA